MDIMWSETEIKARKRKRSSHTSKEKKQTASHLHQNRDKNTHNEEEKRRKGRINSSISKLSLLLFEISDQKLTKIRILEKAVKYIEEKESERVEIRKLLLTVKELEETIILLLELLRAHSVRIPDHVIIPDKNIDLEHSNSFSFDAGQETLVNELRTDSQRSSVKSTKDGICNIDSEPCIHDSSNSEDNVENLRISTNNTYEGKEQLTPTTNSVTPVNYSAVDTTRNSISNNGAMITFITADKLVLSTPSVHLRKDPRDRDLTVKSSDTCKEDAQMTVMTDKKVLILNSDNDGQISTLLEQHGVASTSKTLKTASIATKTTLPETTISHSTSMTWTAQHATSSGSVAAVTSHAATTSTAPPFSLPKSRTTSTTSHAETSVTSCAMASIPRSSSIVSCVKSSIASVPHTTLSITSTPAKISRSALPFSTTICNTITNTTVAVEQNIHNVASVTDTLKTHSFPGNITPTVSIPDAMCTFETSTPSYGLSNQKSLSFIDSNVDFVKLTGNEDESFVKEYVENNDTEISTGKSQSVSATQISSRILYNTSQQTPTNSTESFVVVSSVSAITSCSARDQPSVFNSVPLLRQNETKSEHDMEIKKSKEKSVHTVKTLRRSKSTSGSNIQQNNQSRPFGIENILITSSDTKVNSAISTVDSVSLNNIHTAKSGSSSLLSADKVGPSHKQFFHLDSTPSKRPRLSSSGHTVAALLEISSMEKKNKTSQQATPTSPSKSVFCGKDLTPSTNPNTLSLLNKSTVSSSILTSPVGIICKPTTVTDSIITCSSPKCISSKKTPISFSSVTLTTSSAALSTTPTAITTTVRTTNLTTALTPTSFLGQSSEFQISVPEVSTITDSTITDTMTSTTVSRLIENSYDTKVPTKNQSNISRSINTKAFVSSTVKALQDSKNAPPNNPDTSSNNSNNVNTKKSPNPMNTLHIKSNRWGCVVENAQNSNMYISSFQIDPKIPAVSGKTKKKNNNINPKVSKTTENTMNGTLHVTTVPVSTLQGLKSLPVSAMATVSSQFIETSNSFTMASTISMSSSNTTLTSRSFSQVIPNSQSAVTAMSLSQPIMTSNSSPLLQPSTISKSLSESTTNFVPLPLTSSGAMLNSPLKTNFELNMKIPLEQSMKQNIFFTQNSQKQPSDTSLELLSHSLMKPSTNIQSVISNPVTCFNPSVHLSSAIAKPKPTTSSQILMSSTFTTRITTQTTPSAKSILRATNLITSTKTREILQLPTVNPSTMPSDPKLISTTESMLPTNSATLILSVALPTKASAATTTTTSNLDIVRTMKDRTIKNKWLQPQPQQQQQHIKQLELQQQQRQYQHHQKQQQDKSNTSNPLSNPTVYISNVSVPTNDQCASPVISYPPNTGKRKRKTSQTIVTSSVSSKRQQQRGNSTQDFSAESLSRSSKFMEKSIKNKSREPQLSTNSKNMNNISVPSTVRNKPSATGQNQTNLSKTVKKQNDHKNMQRLRHQPVITSSNSLPTILNIFAPAPLPTTTATQQQTFHQSAFSNFSAETLLGNECNIGVMDTNNMADAQFNDSMMISGNSINSQLFTNFSADTLISGGDMSFPVNQHQSQNTSWSQPWFSSTGDMSGDPTSLLANINNIQSNNNIQNVNNNSIGNVQNNNSNNNSVSNIGNSTSDNNNSFPQPPQRQRNNTSQQMPSTECSPIKSIISILNSSPNNPQFSFENFNLDGNLLMPNVFQQFLPRFPFRESGVSVGGTGFTGGNNIELYNAPQVQPNTWINRPMLNPLQPLKNFPLGSNSWDGVHNNQMNFTRPPTISNANNNRTTNIGFATSHQQSLVQFQQHKQQQQHNSSKPIVKQQRPKKTGPTLGNFSLVNSGTPT